MQDTLAEALLEAVPSPVGVFLPVGEHGVDPSGELVGGSHAFGLVHARAQAPVGLSMEAARGLCEELRSLVGNDS